MRALHSKGPFVNQPALRFVSAKLRHPEKLMQPQLYAMLCDTTASGIIVWSDSADSILSTISNGEPH